MLMHNDLDSQVLRALEAFDYRKYLQGNYKAPDKTMVRVNANADLLTIVIDIIFLT